LLGGSSIFQFAIVANSLGKVLEANEAIEPLNNVIRMTMTVVLVVGCVQCLCGAAFWLPTVKNVLAIHRSEGLDDDWFNSEPNDLGISLGPAITMSGPEFLEWVKENEGDQSSGGLGVYIQISESLLPEDRHKKYENPIHDFLKAGDFGYVDGGGTMMGAEQKQIEFIGIDAVVFEREAGVEAVIQILRELDAPKGTEIRLGDEDVVNVW